jgi:hypothetical protein
MPGGGGKGGGGSSSTVTVNNGPITVDSDSTVDIVGLDDIKVTALVPQPIKTESKQELILPQPLRTESKSDSQSNAKLETKSAIDLDADTKSALSVDLKPVALDVCMTSSTKLPQGRISQPFNYHFGLTWFGMEVFGFNFGGESRVILEDLPKKPAVEWPAQQNAAAPPPCRADDPAAGPPPGLRVRIK